MATLELDRAADAILAPKPQLERDVEERIKRGRARMRDGAVKRNECFRFWRGEQYVYRSSTGYLVNQSTVTDPDGAGKPRWRVRTTRNYIRDIVQHKVSAATQRVPAYEINPSTPDPEDQSAARLAGDVARYGYDKWSIRRITESVVTFALVGDEGFAWPYWDSSVGPFHEDPITGEVYGEGEVKIRVFGPNEVYWEPGIQFEESRWCAVEQARTLDEVKAMEGYIGGELKPDAQSDDLKEDGKALPHSKLVLVTDYLERPCLKYPKGRWLTIADKRLICEPRDYPLTDVHGEAADEPVLHQLFYVRDPDSDRNLGLVRDLLDPQRVANDCANKQSEWKNLTLNPQFIIRNGELVEERTDEPGAVFTATGSGEIEVIKPPAVPGALEDMKQSAIADMARISAQNDIPGNVESGKGIAALLEKDASREANFFANLADFHSRLMRACLTLVQLRYTEKRILPIVGRWGPDRISDFLGAQLRGQVDVSVLPGSIEPRTRQATEQKTLAFADRGWISPEAAMAAINGGTAEALGESYQLDVSRANQVIQMIRTGTFLDQPPRPVFSGEDPGWEVEPVYGEPQQEIDPETGGPAVDPLTGEPVMGEPQIIKPGIPATSMPGWMPRASIDNVAVHLAVLADWCKTPAFFDLSLEQMQAANLYIAACRDIQAKEAQREAELQTQQAEALGRSNAAKPQRAKPMPDQLSLDTSS